jgi:tRNA(Ile)-lysidine synthase
MGPDPAVAAVRLGVRRSLAGLDRGSLVLAACSGGPDSLALAAALAFEAPKLGLRAGAITVDHGLQPGSADQADRVVGTLRTLELDPVCLLRAAVSARGDAAGYPGPEAAARQARYAAIEAAEIECGAAAVLLGHTMDDQAETVLLGLARGSGARSLAGMQASAGRYRRPLLGIRRAQTRAACAALGLDPWDDPQNTDESYARVRVRAHVLPLMEDLLGPGITEALARTADSLRADADALDAVADDTAKRLMPDCELALDVAELAALPEAIRTRLLRRAAVAAGAPSGSLGWSHVQSLNELVTAWRGQRWSDLPGGVRCHRRYGRLQFTTRS